MTTNEKIAALRAAAQAAGYFSEHDDDPSLCTQLRAEQDAKRVFKEYGKPAPAAPVHWFLLQQRQSERYQDPPHSRRSPEQSLFA